MEILKSFLNQIHTINNDILEEYIFSWENYSVPSKYILLNAGEIERHLYFVINGIQKSYYLHEGKEHVIAFTYPPSFSGIPDSFLIQKPSRYFFETITESTFYRISYEKHQIFLLKYREIETLFRKATELMLIGMIHRHYELMAYSITERFRSFLTRSPHLLNQIPHKDLASYLRIDATNFSKLLNTIKI